MSYWSDAANDSGERDQKCINSHFDVAKRELDAQAHITFYDNGARFTI